jgi:hypothetical protein
MNTPVPAPAPYMASTTTFSPASWMAFQSTRARMRSR